MKVKASHDLGKEESEVARLRLSFMLVNRIKTLEEAHL